MTSSLAECDVCHENFDEDQRCPRLLPCYHSVCSICIEHLIANNKKSCPTCRKAFEENTADELAVNYCAAELIKHINDLESNAISPDMYHEAPKPKKIDFLKNQAAKILSSSLTDCEKTIELLKQSVQKNEVLKDSIESMNKELKEGILDKVNQMVKKNDSKVEALSDKNDVLADKLNDLEKCHENLINIRDNLSECASENYVKIAPILDEVEKNKSVLKRKIDVCKDAISKEPEHHQELKKIALLFGVNEEEGVTEVRLQNKTTPVNVSASLVPMPSTTKITPHSVNPNFIFAKRTQ